MCNLSFLFSFMMQCNQNNPDNQRNRVTRTKCPEDKECPQEVNNKSRNVKRKMQFHMFHAISLLSLDFFCSVNSYSINSMICLKNSCFVISWASNASIPKYMRLL